MRWLPYFILAYLIVGLQIGLRPYVTIGSAWPNFVLLIVIFIAINAPRDAALLGAFTLGVFQDLTTSQSLGVFAFSYGLVAMFTVSTQQVVYRGHPLTHFSLAFVGGCLTGLIIFLHGWLRGPWISPMSLFYSALYSAILAPVFLGLLNKIRKGFAFQPARRKIRL